jgi:hypothetical protein
MYDHPYDHVPAMVLSEAARQCAVLSTGSDGRLLSLAGKFVKFAELDVPIALTARRTQEVTRMIARQADVTVAEVDIVLG